MSNQEQFKKVFDCMTCGGQIKLTRKPDNSGWLRFDLDGVTEHKCQKNKKNQQPQQEQQLPATLSEKVYEIDKKLDKLLELTELILRQEKKS
jgi:hypothetical protein